MPDLDMLQEGCLYGTAGCPFACAPLPKSEICARGRHSPGREGCAHLDLMPWKNWTRKKF